MQVASRLLRYFTVLWLMCIIVLFAVISVLIGKTPDFPLGLGWFHTHGIAGLLVTIPSSLLAATGLGLLFVKRRLGASIVLVYSLFWAANFLWAVFSILPTIIRHPVVVCSSGTCDSLPVAIIVITGFALCAFSSGIQSFQQNV